MRGLSLRIAPLEFVASTSHAVELVWWWMWNGPVGSHGAPFSSHQHHAPRTMHHAPCTTHRALFTMHHSAPATSRAATLVNARIQMAQ